MKKVFSLIISIVLTTSALFAEYNASLSEFTGKVEFKASGSSSWTKASVGMKVDAGTTISVGLKSTAVLKIGQNTINVKPLTRLTIKELVDKGDKLNTDIFLDTGKVNFDVAKIEGKKQEFKIGSPIATASVRGTNGDFDCVEVECLHGLVEVFGNDGNSIQVGGGESGYIDPYSDYSDFQSALEEFFSDTSDGTDLFSDYADYGDFSNFDDDFFDSLDLIDQLNNGGATILTITIH